LKKCRVSLPSPFFIYLISYSQRTEGEFRLLQGVGKGGGLIVGSAEALVMRCDEDVEAMFLNQSAFRVPPGKRLLVYWLDTSA